MSETTKNKMDKALKKALNMAPIPHQKQDQKTGTYSVKKKPSKRKS